MTAADLEKFCLTLPGTKQDIKWGHDLCYIVGDKMYCVTPLEGALTASFKVLPEEMQVLIERKGILPAPYMARNHWVLVEHPGALTPKQWKHYIRQSYDLIVSGLPGRLQKKLK